MDAHTSELPESTPSRDTTLNQMIHEMLTQTNPLERENLSTEQKEAVRAVMLTTYNNMNASTVTDDTAKTTQLDSALLQQSSQTIRILDELCLQLVKELSSNFRIAKAMRPNSGENQEPGPASPAPSSIGFNLDGLNRESRVTKSIKHIEMQLQASLSRDQPHANIGFLRSKIQISLPESGNISIDPNFTVSRPQSSETPSDSPADASQIPEPSLSIPDVSEGSNRDAEHSLRVQRQDSMKKVQVHSKSQIPLRIPTRKISQPPPSSATPTGFLSKHSGIPRPRQTSMNVNVRKVGATGSR